MRPVSMTTTLAALLVALASPAFAQAPAAPAAPQAPAVSAPAPAVTPPSTAARPAPQAALLDINTATKDELDKLPGIGAARAEAIVKGRPYKAKNELVDKKIIPEAAYDGIKDRIVARQKS